MPTQIVKRLIKTGLFLLVSILFIFIIIYIVTKTHDELPQAKQGVLDLSGWNLAKDGPVMLDGEWEFYEGQLLTSADFNKSNTAMSNLNVPHIWTGKTSEGGMDQKGFGTYRLKVLLQDKNEGLGLKIRSIRLAHRLYVNGKLESESGQPASSKERYKPGNTPSTAFFQTENNEVELVIQVSNFEFVTGGIVSSIPFGTDEDISKLNGKQLGTEIGIILIMGMFGTYHLSFYYLGRRNKAYLFSGLYLLILTLETSLYGEKVFQQLIPNIPFIITYKLLDLSQVVSAVVIILFFCSVDDRLIEPKKMMKLLIPFHLYITAIFLLPYRIHISLKEFILYYIALLVSYIIIKMYYLYLRSEQGSSEGKELLLFIGSGISLMAFLINDSLYSENIVASDWLGKLGVIGFIVIINILLAVRFSNAYEKTEILSRQLLISNQLKDEFLMSTSHEIKTPLHGIMNMTAHLLEDEDHNLQPKQKQNLWLIKDTSTKLSMLIHDLIDVSRLKYGELRLQLTIVDVRVAVQTVFDVLQFELAGKSVRLENEIANNVWVQADESRLRQVLYNLVYNAIKHTDNGVIKIQSAASENMVSIVVEDTGTGISSDNQSAIFEYFEQLETTLPMDGYTGMGVGLYISRKLVERMGGEIRVDWSELGEGTRMLFTLPKVELMKGYHEVASAVESEMQKRITTDGFSLDIIGEQGHTILIVDDEASNIHSLLNILSRHRYNVITAFSAKEALDKMIEYPKVDLVIVDVMMPVTSGIDLCRTLRGRYSILDLPILFATVKDTPPDIILGFRAGANDYITKPFDGETLLARIQTLIAMKTSIQEAIQNELAFHQAQIKPHFLFNALSSVISFCYTDGEKAAYLLSKLSQYIRYILDTDRSNLVVSLDRELELIHAYVEIEKARFGERFTFVCQVDVGLQDVEIPSLCIQPFVENAIRHGLFHKEGKGTVTLLIREGHGYIQVTIEDDGVGIPERILHDINNGEYRDGGIALSNIRKRLEPISEATFTVESDPGLGTKITMYLPYGIQSL